MLPTRRTECGVEQVLLWLLNSIFSKNVMLGFLTHKPWVKFKWLFDFKLNETIFLTAIASSKESPNLKWPANPRLHRIVRYFRHTKDTYGHPWKFSPWTRVLCMIWIILDIGTILLGQLMMWDPSNLVTPTRPIYSRQPHLVLSAALQMLAC